nr:CAP domain-containing protein [Arthrobacter caoxuetaonis]
MTALAPIVLAACSGPAAAPDRETLAPTAPFSKNVGTVEKTYPKSKGTVDQAYPKSKGTLEDTGAKKPAHTDPTTVPKGEATEPAPAVAETVSFSSHRAVHIVQPGDTLESIALDNGWGAWPEVAAYNNIRAPYVLFEGQRISQPVAAAASILPAGLTLTPAGVEEAEAAPDPAEAPEPEQQDEQPAPVEPPAKDSPAQVEPSPAAGTEQDQEQYAAEPEVPAVVETPAVETPVVSEPVAEEPAVQTPAPEEPAVEVPAVQGPIAAPPEAPADKTPAPGSTAFAQRSLELINEYRAENGVHALTYDPALEALAVTWAASQKEAIDAYGWEGIAHNPNLASELPAGWSNYAENIAVNYTPEAMMQWWKNSPAHNAAMLSPALDSFGFGSAELDPESWLANNHVGVQVFARY